MCGKTTFLKKVLQNQLKMFNLKFSKILWCYSETAAKPNVEGVDFHRGVPKDIENSKSTPMLIVLDDLMSEAYNATVSDIFTKKSHHSNISVILVLQNIFHQGAHSRDISLNAKYVILFKNPRDRQQFNCLARQVFPENPKELIRVYNEVTQSAHSYFIIDLTQDINDLLRFRTDIFNPNYIAVCYSPINGSSKEIQTEEIEGQSAYVVCN
jgi:hypothetical protein